MENAVHHWVWVERTGIAAGDQVSADAGGLPIYRVVNLDEARAWLREERSGRDHILPLEALHWKLVP